MGENSETQKMEQNQMLSQILNTIQLLQESMVANTAHVNGVKEEMKKINMSNKSMESKMDDMVTGNEAAKEKMETLESRIDYFEREKRKRNIIIHGLRENHGETWREREMTVMELLQNKLKSNVQIMEIDSIKRIGKIKVNKTRPIIVAFTTLRRKIEIMSQKKVLKDTDIYIQQDFTDEVIKKRKELNPLLTKLRSEGKTAVMRYDTLYVDGKRWNNEPKLDKQKRKPSESPEIRSDNFLRGNISTKKIKTNRTLYQNSNSQLDGSVYNTDSDEFASPSFNGEDKEEDQTLLTMGDNSNEGLGGVIEMDTKE